VAAAPDAFSIDDEDLAVVTHENPGRELRAQVRAAVGACPVLAISITEDSAGD
jgi:ferredoxin